MRLVCASPRDRERLQFVAGALWGIWEFFFMFSCSFVDRNSLLVSEFGFRVACKLFSRKSVFLVAAAGVFRPPRRFSLNLLIGFRQTIFIRSKAARLK